MPKWAKCVLAVLLLPFCWGAVAALSRVLAATARSENIWVAFIGGAACWLVVFLMLPKPMRVYVFGHELTHVVWTWLFGGRVKRFKTSSRGGHVVVTKSNFLVALAPYFFPLYALLVVALFVLGDWLWNWRPYQVWFHFLLGAAYSFHVTLTLHILGIRQSDITSQGYLFSAVTIFLGNSAVLLVALPLLTSEVGVVTALEWWLAESGALWQRLTGVL